MPTRYPATNEQSSYNSVSKVASSQSSADASALAASQASVNASAQAMEQANEQAQIEMDEKVNAIVTQAKEKAQVSANKSNLSKRIDDAYSVPSNGTRIPWKLTTAQRVANGDSYALAFNVNPSSYQIENQFRQQIVQAKGGPVIHTFRDPNRGNTNLGFATINMEMSSGSIYPIYKPTSFGNAYEDWKPSFQGTIPKGVVTFYKFLEFIQGDMLYTDFSGDTQVNYQILTINTLLFPHLVLYGFFITDNNYGETADNPTEITSWNSKFQIYKSEPSLTLEGIQGLEQEWKQTMAPLLY